MKATIYIDGKPQEVTFLNDLKVTIHGAIDAHEDMHFNHTHEGVIIDCIGEDDEGHEVNFTRSDTYEGILESLS